MLVETLVTWRVKVMSMWVMGTKLQLVIIVQGNQLTDYEFEAFDKMVWYIDHYVH